MTRDLAFLPELKRVLDGDVGSKDRVLIQTAQLRSLIAAYEAGETEIEKIVKREAKTVEQCFAVIKERDTAQAKLREEVERLREALSGLLGLVDLLRSRDDLPEDVRHALSWNHRIQEARSALNQEKAGS